MKKSFKIVHGYKRDEYIALSRKDLPKAYYSFLTDEKVIFSDGSAIRGKDIMRIEPNWNEVMGWNEDYIPTGDDFAMIGGKRKEFANGLMQSAKKIAQEAYDKNNLSILNQRPEFTLLTSGHAKELGEKMKVKDDKKL